MQPVICALPSSYRHQYLDGVVRKRTSAPTSLIRPRGRTLPYPGKTLPAAGGRVKRRVGRQRKADRGPPHGPPVRRGASEGGRRESTEGSDVALAESEARPALRLRKDRRAKGQPHPRTLSPNTWRYVLDRSRFLTFRHYREGPLHLAWDDTRASAPGVHKHPVGFSSSQNGSVRDTNKLVLP
jgi:hypothetical protein